MYVYLSLAMSSPGPSFTVETEIVSAKSQPGANLMKWMPGTVQFPVAGTSCLAGQGKDSRARVSMYSICLLYTSDAADE